MPSSFARGSSKSIVDWVRAVRLVQRRGLRRNHQQRPRGGAWSEPATWLGKKVPGPEDDAVIQKGDAVDFDRDDSGKTTCRKLFIDPRGIFRLKTGMGKVTCCLADSLESRG